MPQKKAGGTTVTAPDGDVIDLDGLELNDIDLDGVDVDQDILNKLDIKQDTTGADAADVQGSDASGTDAATGDTADIAAGCTSTAACDDGDPCTQADTCTQTVCEDTPNSCGQGAFDPNVMRTMGCGETLHCDYATGQCTAQNSVLWSGTFATSAGWKLQGEW